MELPDLYILRHGVTVANEQGLSAGTLETELTETGINQARAAGNFLKQLSIPQIFSSPQIRTRKTVDALSLGVPVEFDPRLREMCFGEYEGIPFELRRKNGYAFEKFFNDPTLRLPKGENYQEVESRLLSFINEKLQSRTPSVIVTHGATGRILLATLLPHQKNMISKFALGNADVIHVSGGNFSVIFETEKTGKSLESVTQNKSVTPETPNLDLK